MHTLDKPKKGDYNPYYDRYIDLVKDVDVVSLLRQNAYAVPAFFYSVPSDKWHYRYAEGKWSIAEVALHLIDTEQVFCYRALRIARGDKTPMVGFDQDVFASASYADDRKKEDVIDEYYMTRRATLALIEGLDERVKQHIGQLENNNLSLSAVIHTIAGHEAYHMQVLMERYL